MALKTGWLKWWMSDHSGSVDQCSLGFQCWYHLQKSSPAETCGCALDGPWSRGRALSSACKALEVPTSCMKYQVHKIILSSAPPTLSIKHMLKHNPPPDQFPLCFYVCRKHSLYEHRLEQKLQVGFPATEAQKSGEHPSDAQVSLPVDFCFISLFQGPRFSRE